MSVADIIILIVVFLILGLIIFFKFYIPKRDGVSVECSSCPSHKNAKKYLKQYRKKYKK